MAGTFSTTQVTVKQATAYTSTPAGFTKVITYSGGSADDGWFNPVSLPTPFKFNGTIYSQAYFGTNGYITFGGGSQVFSGLSASSPPQPSMRFGAGDRSAQALYYGQDSTTGAFLVRVEGGSTSSAASPVIWEYYFFPDGSFMAAIGGAGAPTIASSPTSATWGWSSGSAYLSGVNPGIALGASGGPTSAVYRTADSGVTWTGQSGSYAQPGSTYWNLLDKNTNVKGISAREIRNDVAGGWYSCRTNTSKTTGKYYFEANYELNNGPGVIVGIATAANTLANYPGADPTSIGLWDNGGNWLGGSGSGSVGTIADGGIIGFILDCDAKTLSATADGVNYTAVNTFSFAGPYYVIGSFNSGPVDLIAGWAASDFVYAPPAGAQAWDSTASTGGGTGTQTGTLTDTGAVSDAASARAAASAPLSDTRSATDTATATAAASAALSDTGAVSDSLSASASQAASLADTGAVSDSLASSTAIQGSVSDTGAISDAAAASVAVQAALSDTGAASDTLAGSSANTAALTDTGATTDTAAATAAASSALSDTGAVSDTAAARATVSAAVADTGAITDTLSATAVSSAALADTGAVADAVAVTASAFTALTDAGAINDNTAASAAAQGTLSDAGAIADMLAGSSANTGALTDAGSALDAVAVSSAAASAAVSDTGTASDSVAATASAARALSDTGTISDALAASPAFVIALSDTGAATDTVAGSSVLTGALSDAGSISDAVAATASAAVALSDTGAIGDAVRYQGEGPAVVLPPYAPAPYSTGGGGGGSSRGSDYSRYDAEAHRQRELEEEEARRPRPVTVVQAAPPALPVLGSPLTIDLPPLPMLPPDAALGALPMMPPLVEPMAALLADDEEAIALLLAA